MYTPLGKSQIRLITFAEGDPLKCTIEVCDLKSRCPPFWALSYTWGDAMYATGSINQDPPTEMSRTILCHDTQVAITQNTFDACCQLRQLEQADMRFWVDAICINQNDLSEREQQVHMMSRIYSAAEVVLVWLGASYPALDHFIWATDTLTPKLDKLSPKPGLGEIFDRHVADPALSEELGEEDMSLRIYEFCKFIGSCRWFSRAWVLQEVACARQIRLQCGEHELSWSRASRLCEHLEISGWAGTLRAFAVKFFDDPDFNYNGSEFPKKETFRQFYTENPVPSPPDTVIDHLIWMYGAHDRATHLVSMLSYFASSVQTFKSSDPRDKIFAMIGLVDRFFPDAVEEVFAVDYHSDVESVYKKFAEMVILKVPLLNTLCYVTDPAYRNLPKLPSWVPDFTALAYGRPFLAHGKGNLFPPLAFAPVPSITRRIEGSVLYCQGAAFDTVKVVCKSLCEEMESKPAIEDFLELGAILPYSFRGQHRVECLWRVLIADTFGPYHPAPDSIATNFRTALLLLGALELGGLLYGEAKPPEKVAEALSAIDSDQSSGIMPTIEELTAHCQNVIKFRDSTDAGQVDPELQKQLLAFDEPALAYLKQIAPHSQRRPFVTDNGLIGLGPASTQPGDLICYLHAASVPFVLRPRTQSAHRQFIGESYLHGFMHGEVFGDEFGWLEQVHEISMM